MLCRLAIASSLLLMQATAIGRPVPAEEPVTPAPMAFTILQDEEPEPEREPGPADLEEATEIALKELKQYGGRVARAVTVVHEGKQVHEIRIFGDDGVVRTVRVDPETGAVIPQESRDD